MKDFKSIVILALTLLVTGCSLHITDMLGDSSDDHKKSYGMVYCQDQVLHQIWNNGPWRPNTSCPVLSSRFSDQVVSIENYTKRVGNEHQNGVKMVLKPSSNGSRMKIAVMRFKAEGMAYYLNAECADITMGTEWNSTYICLLREPGYQGKYKIDSVLLENSCGSNASYDARKVEEVIDTLDLKYCNNGTNWKDSNTVYWKITNEYGINNEFPMPDTTARGW